MRAPKADAIRRALQAGMTLKRAAERAGAHYNYARLISIKLGYHKPTRAYRPRNEALRQAIRDAYANHTPLADIAALYGSTVGSIKVLACRMGISCRNKEAAELRTATRVPAHLMADYRYLRGVKRFKAAEVRAMLGLAP